MTDIRQEYRRRPSSDVWHFVPWCRWWPPLVVLGGQKKATAVTMTKPTTGEFCNECQAKERRARQNPTRST